jgi:hypothetical protein
MPTTRTYKVFLGKCFTDGHSHIFIAPDPDAEEYTVTASSPVFMDAEVRRMAQVYGRRVIGKAMGNAGCGPCNAVTASVEIADYGSNPPGFDRVRSKLSVVKLVEMRSAAA